MRLGSKTHLVAETVPLALHVDELVHTLAQHALARGELRVDASLDTDPLELLEAGVTDGSEWRGRTQCLEIMAHLEGSVEHLRRHAVQSRRG